MELNSPYNQFVTTLNSQYSQLTLDITKKLSKDDKKNGGIFITPNIIISKPVASFYQLPYEFGSNLIDEVIIEGKRI